MSESRIEWPEDWNPKEGWPEKMTVVERDAALGLGMPPDAKYTLVDIPTDAVYRAAGLEQQYKVWWQVQRSPVVEGINIESEPEEIITSDVPGTLDAISERICGEPLDPHDVQGWETVVDQRGNCLDFHVASDLVLRVEITTCTQKWLRRQALMQELIALDEELG